MEKLRHILWQVRLVAIAILLLVAGGGAIWAGMRDYRSTSAESGPTTLGLDTVDHYGGQRWLTIEQGVFLTDQAVVRVLPRNPDNAEDQVLLFVPVVQRGWQPDSPVHVVGQFGPSPRSKAAGWLQGNGGGVLRAFTGIVVDEPTASLFPNLKFNEPVLVVKEGDQLPSAGLSIGLMALGVVMVLAGGALGLMLLLVWVKVMKSKRSPAG